MPFAFVYTKPGVGVYPKHNYPTLTALNCDWEHAMHMALSRDGETYVPMRNNTGILFPRATFTEGKPEGTTKTMLDPWVYRACDGTFGVVCVRRNQNAPDPLTVGCLMRFTSNDLVRYEEAGFLKLSDGEIRRPRCAWDAEKGAYYLEWEADSVCYCGWTKYFMEVTGVEKCISPRLSPASGFGIPDAVPGNVIEITDAEDAFIRRYFDVIENVGVAPIELELSAGSALAELPKAVCLYSDGSTHEKEVNWNADDLAAVDVNAPGEYAVRGKIKTKHWPFPMRLSGERQNMSDPAVLYYEGKYYLTSSGGQDVILRCAERLEDVFTAEPIVIHHVADIPGANHIGTWAAELHIIKGVPHILTAVCPEKWYLVQSHILRCNGEITDPAAWEAPRLCVKANGEVLTKNGISLDMTYFEVRGVHYVMWSDRKFVRQADDSIAEPADIYIATVDPDAPWKLTSEPVCVLRPIYGWDRYETEVDEGPYLIRHGEDLFITVSGSSTGLADLYDLGFLHAKEGANLLDPAAWDWIPFPFLTKESVPGEFGPGHNSFVKDHETGDDMMVYHAVPHDENDKTLGRMPGVRRVHWAKSGYPYLEMTEERDLKEKFRAVTMKVTVK